VGTRRKVPTRASLKLLSLVAKNGLQSVAKYGGTQRQRQIAHERYSSAGQISKRRFPVDGAQKKLHNEGRRQAWNASPPP
jgi:hypothetical protein